MYSFLTGPLLWISLLVFVVGLAARVVLYIRGLDWRLERVAYGPGREIGIKGALASIIQWLVPFGTHSMRRQPFFTVGFFLFHAGLVLAPLFFVGHNVVLHGMFGFSLPSLPIGVVDALTLCGLLGGIMLGLRRLALPEVRFLSNAQDWAILLLCLFVLFSGFMTRMQAPGYADWLLWHIFSGELVLLLAPFTKLSHIVLYFMSRGQLGMDFAIKRGGATRGPVYPW